MPRPNKSGLDYFPLDVHLDEKIELIEAKHGLLGFGIIIKLFQSVYKNGYYLDATEERLLLLKRRIGADHNLIIEVINDALKWGIFDNGLYAKSSVLTSKGVQKRYIEATKRRKEVEFIKEYILLSNIESRYPDKVDVNIIDINANIKPENEDINKQSKVKESKEDNIYSRVVGYLNRKTNSKFKPETKDTIRLIKARVGEGFVPDDFKSVIDFKCLQWLDDGEKQEFLRPQTLFSNKFEGYLNAANRKITPLPTQKPETQEEIDARIAEKMA